MLRPLLKVTFVAWIWQNYRHLIGSTLVLFTTFWLINRVHQDFLSYLALKGSDDGAGISFVFKWLAVLLAVVIYFLFNTYFAKRAKERGKGKGKGNSKLNDKTAKAQTKSSIFKTSFFSKHQKSTENEVTRTTDSRPEKHDQRNENDPFSFLRGTKPLRSRAEMVIDENRVTQKNIKTKKK